MNDDEPRKGNQCVECRNWHSNRNMICDVCAPKYPDRLVDDVDPANREPKEKPL